MMYPDLYRGIGLRRKISSSTICHWGFNGWMVIPKRQISLPVNMEGNEVMVTFIVVSTFSPYTAILGRPWIQTMGVVPSTLHLKVKFCMEWGIAIVRGS